MKRFETTVNIEGQPVEVILVEREKRGNTRVHVFVEEGTETMLDNLMNRGSRPVEQWRVLATRTMRELGLDPQEAYLKLRWSQKAGCSCGCSPGFIMADFAVRCALPGIDLPYASNGYDLMITPKPVVAESTDHIVLSEN
jgi:hypothetical protein